MKAEHENAAIFGHRNWNYFTRAAGLCLLALVSDLGLLRRLAGLDNVALVGLLGNLTLVGKLILLLLRQKHIF